MEAKTTKDEVLQFLRECTDEELATFVASGIKPLSDGSTSGVARVVRKALIAWVALYRAPDDGVDVVA